jgi:hypothetical protein
MSATHRSWDADEVCTAIRTAFPGVPPERLTQTAFAVEEEHGDTEVGPPPEHYAEESVEDDITDEIDAIVEAHRLLYRAKAGLAATREILETHQQLLPQVEQLLAFIATQQEGRHGRALERRRAA